MKFKFIVFALITMFFLSFKSIAAQTNSLRIEQEGKLLVNQEKADIVWQWLQDEYINNQTRLSQLDPSLTSNSSEEQFTDTYYDTPKQELLDKQNSVRHRQRENITNPADRKSGQELVQIKLSNISDNQLNRSEYKYEVDLTNKFPNQHPLIGIIKKAQRDDFINQLADIDIKASSLRPVLVLKDYRKRLYFEKDGKPFISISLDQTQTNKWWFKAEFTEIEFELNEITYTENDEMGRKYMESINHQIIEEIKAQFPDIVTDLTPKYNKAFKGLEKKIPFFRSLIRWGII
ncbi:MAG: CYTH domain-containing protein [Candidatus Beckwithbacteria bacterium]